MFSKETYTARREVLSQSVGSGIVLFLGNEEVGMNARDNWYHFRQDSSFLYYIGLNQASLAAIIDIDEHRTTVYGNELTVDDIVWTGPMPSIAAQATEAGISHTAPQSGILNALRKAQEQGRTIHFLPPYRDEQTLKLHEWLNLSAGEVAGAASV